MPQLQSLVDKYVGIWANIEPVFETAARATKAPSATAFVVLAFISTTLAFLLFRHYTPRRLAAAILLLAWPFIELAFLAGIGQVVLVVALTVIASLAVGLAIAARSLAALTYVERWGAAFALGLGTVGMFVFALAIAGWLTAPVFVATALLLVAGSLVAFRGHRAFVEPPANVEVSEVTLLFLWLCALIVQATSVYVVAPELNYDSTYYHLTLAKDFAAAGGAPSIPELWTSNIPILPQLLYAATTTASSIDSGRVLNFTVGLASLVLVYAIGSRLRGPLAGALAVVIWLAPLVLWEMASAYVDPFLVLWSLTGVLGALVWSETRQRSYALAAATSMGFGFGVKVGMFYVALPLMIALLAFYVRRRSDLIAWLAAGAAGIAVAAPWYARSYVLTGNPIFPLYNGIFRSPLWEPVNSSFNFEGFGMGHGVVDFALLPWRLTFDTRRFVEAPDLSLGVLPLLMGIGVVIAMLRGSRRDAFLAVIVIAGTIVWFVSVDYARYLLPVLAIGAPLAAMAVVGLLQMRWATGRFVSRGGVMLFGFLIIPGLVLMMWNVPGAVPWNVDLGIAARPAYLRDALRHYRAYEWISKNLPDAQTARILGVGLSEWPIAYSTSHIFIGHQTQDGNRVLQARTDDEVMRQLSAADFRYVIVDEFPRPNPATTSWRVASDTFIAEHLRLLYANAYVYVYAIAPPEDGGSEVLQDPQLATYRAALASSPWKVFGTAPRSADGCAGVEISSEGGMLQSFAAEENVLYAVEMTITSVSAAPAYGKLQVNWNSPDGFVNIEIDPVSAEAGSYMMGTTAPPGATAGTIFVSGYGGAPVCVSSASVKRLAAPR